MLLNSITPEQLTASACALSAQIHVAGLTSNLLGDAAQTRGEIFLTDAKIPIPRVSTILAWASAFSIGPAAGYYRRLTPSSPLSFVPFDLRDGYFLIPFLPKIRGGEDTTYSLSRASGAHKKSVLNHISWGQIYIADSSTGEIIEELDHGQVPISEWLTHKVAGRDRSSLPPLWADFDDGWQFGVDQFIPGLTITPRTPVEMLAKNGIPWVRHFRPHWHIKRLLLRFHSLPSARLWAKGFSSSIHNWTASAMDEDSATLLTELHKSVMAAENAKEAKKEGRVKSTNRKSRLLSQLSEFDGIVDTLDI